MELACSERVAGKVSDRRRRLQADRGGALVEFAVTLPIFLMLITAIFSFSMAIYQKLELAEAVASGGRFIASDRGDTDPCASTGAVIAAAAPTLTPLTVYISIAGGKTSSGTTSAITCTGSAGASNMAAGATASVAAQYSCSIKVYRYSFPGCTIATTIVENVQ